QEPLLLGVADDEQARAILDRLAGIHELGLAQYLASRLLGRAPEADQRRVADDIEYGSGHGLFLLLPDRRETRNSGPCLQGRIFPRMADPSTGLRVAGPQIDEKRQPQRPGIEP